MFELIDPNSDKARLMRVIHEGLMESLHDRYIKLLPHQEQYLDAIVNAELHLLGLGAGAGKSTVRKAVIRYLQKLENEGL